MVDGERQKTPPVVAGPARGDRKQGDGVAAAGQGQGDGPVDVGFEPRGQPFANTVRPGRDDPGGVGRAQPPLRAAGQANWVRNAAARARTAALAPAA